MRSERVRVEEQVERMIGPGVESLRVDSRKDFDDDDEGSGMDEDEENASLSRWSCAGNVFNTPAISAAMGAPTA